MYKPHAVFPKIQALCWKVEHTQLSWGAPAPRSRHVIDANGRVTAAMKLKDAYSLEGKL